MVQNISLEIKDANVKQAYFEILRDSAKIPVCLNCGKLFGLGFPNNETGISDRLICEENYLLCECEHMEMVRNLYSSAKECLVDISRFYR